MNFFEDQEEERGVERDVHECDSKLDRFAETNRYGGVRARMRMFPDNLQPGELKVWCNNAPVAVQDSVNWLADIVSLSLRTGTKVESLAMFFKPSDSSSLPQNDSQRARSIITWAYNELPMRYSRDPVVTLKEEDLQPITATPIKMTFKNPQMMVKPAPKVSEPAPVYNLRDALTRRRAPADEQPTPNN